MGKLEKPTKPTASASNPAPSAKLVALKQKLADQQSRTARLAFLPPSHPEKLKDMISRLSKHDLLLAMNELIDKVPDTRAALRAFSERPSGSFERPYDFTPLYNRCVDGVDIVKGEAWEQAISIRHL